MTNLTLSIMIAISTLFFVFALICFKNIRYGIYAVIFSMPLYLLKFSIFGIPTTVLEMMICILFLVWILNEFHHLLFCHFEPVKVRNLKAILHRNNIYFKAVFGFLNRFAHFEMTKRDKTLNVLNFGIVLLFLGLTISTLNSSDFKTSLGIFKGWFIDPFLFFLVFTNVIKKEKHIILSLKILLASGIAVSLISIFYLLNSNLTFDGRLKAFFLSPNHLAMYISPACLIALFFLLSKLSFPQRRESIATINIQYLIFLIIILIPLYFTYSYGAFLGISAGIIWLFYKIYKSKLSFPRRRESIATINNKLYNKSKTKEQINFKSSSFLRILIGVILISFIIFTTSNKLDQIINSENRSSFHSRLMVWNASVEIIKDSPFFGIGPGTFQDVYLSYSKNFDEPYLEWAVPQPHNIFLAFYLQTGLIGFIGFVLILFWFFANNNLKNKFNIQYSIFNILICLMIYILIHGLVDTTYWKNDLSLMLWMIIGIMVVLRRMSNDTQYIK